MKLFCIGALTFISLSTWASCGIKLRTSGGFAKILKEKKIDKIASDLLSEKGYHLSEDFFTKTLYLYGISVPNPLIEKVTGVTLDYRDYETDEKFSTWNEPTFTFANRKRIAKKALIDSLKDLVEHLPKCK